MNLAKQRIRDRIRQRRKALSRDDIQRMSLGVCERVAALPVLEKARAVGAYLAKPDEVQLDGFIQSLLACGRRVCVPKYHKDDKRYEMVWVDDVKDIRPGRHGVREPDHGLPARFDELDVVLVPGLAFDANGGRLGHGLGYYDKLLQGVPTHKIGLAFDFQFVDSIPVTETDVRMDVIVTELRTVWVDLGTSTTRR